MRPVHTVLMNLDCTCESDRGCSWKVHHDHKPMFQIHVLGRRTVEVHLLAGEEVEAVVESAVAVDLEKIAEADSVCGAGIAAELLALLLQQPTL